MQYIVPDTTEKGGLRSITDSTAQYPPGLRHDFIDKDGNVLRFEYWYNGAGAAAVANNLYWKTFGAAGTNPKAIAIADAQAYDNDMGVAQAAIPSTYWGWYQTEGPTTNRGRVYFDCIDQDGTDTVTDGEGLEISSGVAVDDGNADWAENRLHFAIAIEAVTGGTACYMWLMGGRHLSTA